MPGQQSILLGDILWRALLMNRLEVPGPNSGVRLARAGLPVCEHGDRVAVRRRLHQPPHLAGIKHLLLRRGGSYAGIELVLFTLANDLGRLEARVEAGLGVVLRNQHLHLHRRRVQGRARGDGEWRRPSSLAFFGSACLVATSTPASVSMVGRTLTTTITRFGRGSWPPSVGAGALSLIPFFRGRREALAD